MTIEKKISETEDIIYKVKYSHRRTLGISIHPDKGVVARVPFRTPQKIVDGMIRNKAEWIRKVLKSQQSLNKIDQKKVFADGDTILFMGKKHFLKITPSDKNYICRSEDNIIEIGYTDLPDPIRIKIILETWYKNVARKVLSRKFEEILLKYKDFNFTPTGFSVRKMKKRWGSCTAKGKIAISYDLIRLDDIYGEYVIIHELCHLKHHDHSKEYYGLLSELFPRWKTVRNELQKIIR